MEREKLHPKEWKSSLELKQILSFLLLSFVFSSFVGAEEQGESPDFSVTPLAQPDPSFFDSGKGGQDFFSGRNLSSNSIFSSDTQGVNLNTNIEDQLLRPALDNTNNYDEVTIESNPNKNVSAVVEGAPTSPEEEEALEVASRAKLDPSLQDIVDHSRKIREAIFGEEAMKTLPASIRDKMQNKYPNAKQDATRF